MLQVAAGGRAAVERRRSGDDARGSRRLPAAGRAEAAQVPPEKVWTLQL